MSRDAQLKERWEQLVTILSDRFSQGEDLDLDAIIYLIGIQERRKVKFNAHCHLSFVRTVWLL